MIRNFLTQKKVWLIIATVAIAIAVLSLLPVGDWLTNVKHWLVTLGPWAVPV